MFFEDAELIEEIPCVHPFKGDDRPEEEGYTTIVKSEKDEAVAQHVILCLQAYHKKEIAHIDPTELRLIIRQVLTQYQQKRSLLCKSGRVLKWSGCFAFNMCVKNAFIATRMVGGLMWQIMPWPTLSASALAPYSLQSMAWLTRLIISYAIMHYKYRR